jgi:hypothetical protein
VPHPSYASLPAGAKPPAPIQNSGSPRLSGEFTQAVIQVADVGAAVDELTGRGVTFEEYDTPET